MNDFRGELEQLINLHSKENGPTPRTLSWPVF